MLTFRTDNDIICLEMEMISMANSTTALNVNVNAENKEKATSILKNLGLNMSTAINMFLAQIVKRDGIPFEITNPKPSKDMLEALKEARDIINNLEKHPGFTNSKDLKKALLSDD